MKLCELADLSGFIQHFLKSFLDEKGIPEASFTKDTAHIETKLKLRRISFHQNVKITAPPDILKAYVVIESVEGDPDEAGNPQKWTKILVKDEIDSQQ